MNKGSLLVGDIKTNTIVAGGHNLVAWINQLQNKYRQLEEKSRNLQHELVVLSGVVHKEKEEKEQSRTEEAYSIVLEAATGKLCIQERRSVSIIYRDPDPAKVRAVCKLLNKAFNDARKDYAFPEINSEYHA